MARMQIVTVPDSHDKDRQQYLIVLDKVSSEELPDWTGLSAKGIKGCAGILVFECEVEVA